MSINYNAKLFYGVKITDDKLLQKINNNDLEIDNDLKVVWSGSAYANYGCFEDNDNPCTIFVAIKKSINKVDLYEDNKQIKQEFLLAPKEWHDRLDSWAKENDCSKIKIGWSLIILES